MEVKCKRYKSFKKIENLKRIRIKKIGNCPTGPVWGQSGPIDQPS
jgi:hypothetical protein